MSKIIAVNAGSSSLKFQLFEMPAEDVIASGIVERIGLDNASFTIKFNGEKFSTVVEISDHAKAVELVLKALVDHQIVADLNEITGVGHRIVHGGEYFSHSVLVDQKVVDQVSELADLAPLHNPANLTGFIAFNAALPQATHAFVFDTAFHQTMEADTFLYPLPYEYYTDLKVRRYGFHGTSHYYVSQKTAELMGKDVKDVNIIVCHLGNGASITAVKAGKVVNTSMGFTPLAGIMMGTRCGDIDPAIMPYIMEKQDLSANQVLDIYNKASGMLGISGISSDARDIENAANTGNERAQLTQRMYTNRISQVIGSYFIQLGSLDAIAFTAGLGENDYVIRAMVIDRIKQALNISFDYELNQQSRSQEVLLSKPASKIAVWMVPTNEEVIIARDTYALMNHHEL